VLSETTNRPPGKKVEEQMKAYYWKAFRHMLSTAVLTGFSYNVNLCWRP
jgi:hypothetical protein